MSYQSTELNTELHLAENSRPSFRSTGYVDDETRLNTDAIGTAAILVGLYVAAALVLFSPLGNHPTFPYNWESYTAWHVFSSWFDEFRPHDIFTITDGLMTDSGQGPLIGLPIWAAFKLFGVGLTEMRAPVTLMAAAAVPLLWLVGRKIAGPQAALLAATLFALSPVWLLYGRTATLVGVSVVPALLTVYVLLRMFDYDRHWLRNLGVLQLLLIVGAYGYAPIRFLWPLSLGLIGLQLVRGHNRQKALLALVVTLCVLPIALTMIGTWTAPGVSTIDRLVGYYNARGEQVLSLNENPTNYSYYLDGMERGEEPVTDENLALKLLQQNTEDMLRLLFDRDTAPALSHYYNPTGQPVGRLYPGIFAPFLILGIAVSIGRFVKQKRPEYLVLLVMAAGFTFPMLLTSRVHIGRLIFALPLMFLLVAIGAIWLATLVHNQLKPDRRGVL